MIVGCVLWPCCVTLRPSLSHRCVLRRRFVPRAPYGFPTRIRSHGSAEVHPVQSCHRRLLLRVAGRRVTADRHIGGPNGHCPLPIQGQRGNRRATDRRATKKEETVLRPAKVILPALLAGVEQGRGGTTLRIAAGPVRRFPPIAVKTGEGEIVEGMRPLMRQRDNVIDGKRHILPLFGGMTVFTQAMGALAYLGLHRAGNGPPTRHRGHAYLWGGASILRTIRLRKLRYSSSSS